jgi:hypothetical protein
MNEQLTKMVSARRSLAWREFVQTRIMPMTLLWLGFGVLVGVLSAPPAGGALAIVSGAIAGMIVLPFMGAFLGLIGGNWRETLLAGVAGLVVGALVDLVNGQLDLLNTAKVGLVGGAIIGATFFSFVNHWRKTLALLTR